MTHSAMKFLTWFFGALAVPAIAAVELEVGASYLVPEGARLERSPRPLSVDEPERVAPFVAASYAFTDAFAVRFSYQFVDNLRATAQFGSPPGTPDGLPVIPIVVWGHYRDDVHIVALAPEFRASLRPNLTLGLAPQLNWVASRGRISYATDYPLILLVAPYDRNDEGFTFGGAARLLWSLSGRTAVSLGYQYLDLEPSFDREAHVLSAGLLWKF